MNRRDTVLALASLGTVPVLCSAQLRMPPVIGLLGSESPAVWARHMRASHEGLGELGYVDGRNVAIEYRRADGHNDRLPALAADLVRRRVAVIAAPGSTPSTLAAKAATTTIPIVFWIGSDPRELGIVANMNRPEENLTGVTTLNHKLVAKRVELVHEVVLGTRSIALLVNPTGPDLARTAIADAQAAAGRLSLELHVLNASAEADFDAVFARLVQQVTKVDLYVNLKTAQALGVNVPNVLIARADEVIE